VLRSDGQRYDQPVVSPDGRHVILRVGASDYNNGDLWLLDISNGVFTPLTRGNNAYRPSWSRDGTRVYYMSGVQTLTTEVRSKSWDGSSGDSVHLKRPNTAEFAEGTRGGWSVLRNFGQRDIFIVPADSLATATPRLFVTGPAFETNPRISPSGRLLAYQSNESGVDQVFVRPLPGPGPRVPVSVDGGTAPRWSPNGSRLLYRANGKLMAATIAEQPELAVSRRDVVLPEFATESGGTLAEWDYDEMPNGAMLTTLPVAGVKQEPWQLVVLTNWQQLLKRRPAGPRTP
jgi:Tol biopolymer transport system component